MAERPEKDEVSGLEVLAGIIIAVTVVLPAIAWWMTRLGRWRC